MEHGAGHGREEQSLGLEKQASRGDPGRKRRKGLEVKTPVAPLTLAMNERNVFLHNGEDIVCLSRSDGKENWRVKPESTLQGHQRN